MENQTEKQQENLMVTGDIHGLYGVKGSGPYMIPFKGTIFAALLGLGLFGRRAHSNLYNSRGSGREHGNHCIF